MPPKVGLISHLTYLMYRVKFHPEIELVTVPLQTVHPYFTYVISLVVVRVFVDECADYPGRLSDNILFIPNPQQRVLRSVHCGPPTLHLPQPRWQTGSRIDGRPDSPHFS